MVVTTYQELIDLDPVYFDFLKNKAQEALRKEKAIYLLTTYLYDSGFHFIVTKSALNTYIKVEQKFSDIIPQIFDKLNKYNG